MINDLVLPVAEPTERPPRRSWVTGSAAIAVVALAMALSGCGARAAHRDATSSTSTTVAVTAPSTTAATTPTSAQPTDDIEEDLTSVQADLDGAAQDLRDGPAEATTDARG